MTIINFNTQDYEPYSRERYQHQITAIEAEEQFIDELLRFGLDVAGQLETEKIVRVSHREKPNKRTGWYVYFGVDHQSGIAGGIYGDWRHSDDYHYWSSKSKIEVTPEQWAQYQQRIQEAKAKAEAEKKRRQDETAIHCQNELSGLPKLTQHVYLDNKQVQAYGLYAAPDGALVVPLCNHLGELRNLQKIYPNGDKYFSESAQVLGCYHQIGEITDTVYICEGYATGATLHQITGKTIVIAFNTANLLPVAKTLRKVYPTIHFVFAADNDRHTKDNPGVTKANEAALCVGNAVVRVPEFSSGDGTDFNDLFRLCGVDEVKKQLASVNNPSRGVQIHRIGDIDHTAQTDWIIDKYLVNDSLVGMYGASGSGKSFVALDFGLSIASGLDWQSRKTAHSGPVLYVCGEGRAGIARRVAAWCYNHDIDYQAVDFYVTSNAVHLLAADQYLDLIDKVKTLQDGIGRPFSAVIIDTLNRNFGNGDENRTDDMTAFINALDGLRRVINGCVLVVHHTGVVDSSRARGNGALRAALDTELEVSRTVDGPINVKCKKQKDAEEPAPVAFTLSPVIYARDDNNNPLSSVVLEPCGYDEPPPQKHSAQPKPGSPKAVALDILRAEIAHCDGVAVASGKEKADECKVDHREFAHKFRTQLRKLKNRNPSAAYTDLMNSHYFSEWTTKQGAWLVIHRDQINE